MQSAERSRGGCPSVCRLFVCRQERAARRMNGPAPAPPRPPCECRYISPMVLERLGLLEQPPHCEVGIRCFSFLKGTWHRVPKGYMALHVDAEVRREPGMPAASPLLPLCPGPCCACWAAERGPVPPLCHPAPPHRPLPAVAARCASSACLPPALHLATVRPCSAGAAGASSRLQGSITPCDSCSRAESSSKCESSARVTPIPSFQTLSPSRLLCKCLPSLQPRPPLALARSPCPGRQRGSGRWRV